jgi:hypothetical protein
MDAETRPLSGGRVSAKGYLGGTTWVWNQYPKTKRDKEGFFFNFMRNLLVFKDSVN